MARFVASVDTPLFGPQLVSPYMVPSSSFDTVLALRRQSNESSSELELSINELERFDAPLEAILEILSAVLVVAVEANIF